MTKQEAIEVIDTISKFIGYDGNSVSTINMQQALNIAIKALEQQEICYCKDYINKETQFEGTELEETYCNYCNIYKIKDTDYCSWGERGEK